MTTLPDWHTASLYVYCLPSLSIRSRVACAAPLLAIFASVTIGTAPVANFPSNSIPPPRLSWRSNDGAVLRYFTHHTGPVTSLALLPDGLRFVSGSHDKTARIAYHGLAPQ